MKNKSIIYCGSDVVEANSWLENPKLSKEEAEKFQMSIWENSRLMNECIKKKIKEDRN
jgi:hypothetical protein